MPNPTELLVHAIPSEEAALAARRLAVVRDLVESAAKREDYLLAARKLKVSVRTVYTLVNRYHASSDRTLRCMLPRKRGRPVGSSFLSPEVEAIISGQITRLYRGKEEVSIQRLYLEIGADCHSAGLVVPTYETIRRRVYRLPPDKRLKGQEGSAAAKQKLTPTPGSFVVAGAYSVLQIDHTPCDIMVVDRFTRTAIGRPWLTLAMDVASRMIVGFYITLEAPSFLSTALCLRHACLPKAPYLLERGFNFAWPCDGLPDNIHSDNGADFHSDDLKRILTAYEIGHQLRPIGEPRYGGHIERLIGTCMGDLHFLPGTTFANAERHRARKYDSSQEACLTLEELEAYFCAQVNIYHNTIHSSLQRPPITAWETEVESRASPIRAIQNYRYISVDFLPSEQRTVSRRGIKFYDITYWNNDLTCLLGEQDRRVSVNYDPRNLSSIYVMLPGGGFIETKYADANRFPISMMERDAIAREIRKNYRGEIHEEQIFSMILAKRKIVAGAISKKTSIKRSAARYIERVTQALEAERPPAEIIPYLPAARTPIEDIEPDTESAQIVEVEDW